MEAFVKDQEKEMEEMLLERKRRKKERTATKRLIVLVTGYILTMILGAAKLATTQAMATPIQRINKVKFDPSTGKRIEVPT